MTRKIFVTQLVERAWDIDGFPEYFFSIDKQLYRYGSRGAIRKNKRILIGYTQGYSLKGKFYSLAQLRPLLRQYTPTDHPPDF